VQYLLIFFGGGLGCVLRYIVSVTVNVAHPIFPLGTLMVNVIGSFLAGFLISFLALRLGEATPWHLALVTGFLGGFTTFSAFSYETVSLFLSSPGMALVNIGANIGLSVAAAAAGFYLSRVV
jgi:fluoride exporter